MNVANYDKYTAQRRIHLGPHWVDVKRLYHIDTKKDRI